MDGWWCISPPVLQSLRILGSSLLWQPLDHVDSQALSSVERSKLFPVWLQLCMAARDKDY